MKPSSKLRVTSVSDQVVQPRSSVVGRFEVGPPQSITLQQFEALQKAPPGYLDIIRSAGPLFRGEPGFVWAEGRPPIRGSQSKSGPGARKSQSRTRRRVSELPESHPIARETSGSEQKSSTPSQQGSTHQIIPASSSGESFQTQDTATASSINAHSASTPASTPSMSVTVMPPSSSAIALAATVFSPTSAGTAGTTSASGTTVSSTQPASSASAPQPTMLPGSLVAALPQEQAAQYLKQYSTALNALTHLKGTITNLGKGLGIQPPAPVSTTPAPTTQASTSNPTTSSTDDKSKDTGGLSASMLEELQKLREENSSLRKTNYKFVNENKSLQTQLKKAQDELLAKSSPDGLGGSPDQTAEVPAPSSAPTM